MRPIPRPNWRTIITVIATLVAVLIYSNIEASSNEQAKQNSINSLTATQAVLLQEVTGLTQDVGNLVTYTRAVGEREQAILAYLNQHGIKLPARLVTQIPAPKIIRLPSTSPRVVTGQASKSHGKGHKK